MLVFLYITRLDKCSPWNRYTICIFILFDFAFKERFRFDSKNTLFWKDKDTWFFQVQNNNKNLKLFAMEILGVGKVLGFNVQKNCKQTFYGIHWKNSFQWKKRKNRKINTEANLGTKKISSCAIVCNCSQRLGFSCGKIT